MRKHHLVILPVLLLWTSTACAGVAGSGVIATEHRKVDDFSEVSLAGGLEVSIRPGPTSVVLEGDDNIIALYRSEVKDGRLTIEPAEKWGRLRPSQRVKATVTTPHLKRLEASGGVQVSLEATTDRALALELSGGVEFNAKGVDVDSLTVDASGGVEVELGGRAQAATFDLSGGVEVHAKALQIASATLEASGGCEVELQVTESLTGEASGGVDIAVSGNPAKRRVETSGLAHVSYAH